MMLECCTIHFSLTPERMARLRRRCYGNGVHMRTRVIDSGAERGAGDRRREQQNQASDDRLLVTPFVTCYRVPVRNKGSEKSFFCEVFKLFFGILYSGWHKEGGVGGGEGLLVCKQGKSGLRSQRCAAG